MLKLTNVYLQYTTFKSYVLGSATMPYAIDNNEYFYNSGLFVLPDLSDNGLHHTGNTVNVLNNWRMLNLQPFKADFILCLIESSLIVHTYIFHDVLDFADKYNSQMC